MTAVLSGLTQPIEQKALLHRKPASHITVRTNRYTAVLSARSKPAKRIS